MPLPVRRIRVGPVRDIAGWPGASAWRFTDKREDRCVELFGSLQRREMTHPRQLNELRIWNGPSEMVGMFMFDEFIVLAVHDGGRHGDLRLIVRRRIRLRFHHDAEGCGEWLELIRRCR